MTRPVNEDAVAVDDRILSGNMDGPAVFKLTRRRHILMVADGMGGHSHGALASRTVLEFLLPRPEALTEHGSCRDAIALANEGIYELMRARPETVGMGTTLAGVAVVLSGILFFNVGDSRIYRHQNGKLTRLSRDDVPSDQPQLGPHRTTHAITQALGGRRFEKDVYPHIGATPPLSEREGILLCSDGLTDMLAEEQIREVLDAFPDPEKSAEKLFINAMKAGGQDNISIAIVRAL